MSGLLEQSQYQDIFRLIDGRVLHPHQQLFYLNIGTVRKYLEDSYWKGLKESQVVDLVKKDIEEKRKTISNHGCFLIIDFEGCGLFNNTLMGLCPKIIKQIICSWTDIVWESYIIRPNTLTSFFLNLIMTLIPKERHNKVTIVKGGLIELVLIMDKLGRHVDEKQWLRNKIS